MGELDPPNPRSHIAHCSSSQRMIGRCPRGVHFVDRAPTQERPRVAWRDQLTGIVPRT